MNRDAPPVPKVRLHNGQLLPADRYTARYMQDMPNGQNFALSKRSNRSTPQNALYWVGLQTLVDATGAWPKAEKAHADMKRALGYTETVVNPLTGEEWVSVDSTAFAKMDAQEFNAFFEQARKLTIETMGFDPWNET